MRTTSWESSEEHVALIQAGRVASGGEIRVGRSVRFGEAAGCAGGGGGSSPAGQIREVTWMVAAVPESVI